MESLEFDISVRDLEIPRIRSAGTNVNLKLINSAEGMKILKKKDSETECTYRVNIPTPLSFGFTSLDQSNMELETQFLLLSLNLVLSRAVVDWQGLELSPLVIEKENESGFKIEDHLAFVKTISDTIDEPQVIETFQDILALKKLKVKTPRDTNLDLALNHYKNAMSNSSTVFVFRDLINSLHQIVVVDGKDISGRELDKRCSELTLLKEDLLEVWRQFLDRLKHIQENDAQVERLAEGIRDHITWIIPIRKQIQSLLRSELVKY